MFGYIKINKPELKIKDYETYKGVYCSLCKEMGKEFGLLSRFTLSYDFAFLALLKMSVAKEKLCFNKSRCTFNPMHKCLKLDENYYITFSVYVYFLMMYYKLKDNIQDRPFYRNILTFLLYPIVSHYYKKSKKKFDDIDLYLSDQMSKQKQIENDNSTDIDCSSNPSAKMLGYIFSYGEYEENQKRILNHLGFCIGRLVYILDAIEDFDKDYKNNEYNTLVLKYKNNEFNKETLQSYKEGILNRTLTEIINTYELLDVYSNKDILDNIIYEGLEKEKQRVLKTEVNI